MNFAVFFFFLNSGWELSQWILLLLCCTSYVCPDQSFNWKYEVFSPIDRYLEHHICEEMSVKGFSSVSHCLLLHSKCLIAEYGSQSKCLTGESRGVWVAATLQAGVLLLPWQNLRKCLKKLSISIVYWSCEQD